MFSDSSIFFLKPIIFMTIPWIFLLDILLLPITFSSLILSCYFIGDRFLCFLNLSDSLSMFLSNREVSYIFCYWKWWPCLEKIIWCPVAYSTVVTKTRCSRCVFLLLWLSCIPFIQMGCSVPTLLAVHALERALSQSYWGLCLGLLLTYRLVKSAVSLAVLQLASLPWLWAHQMAGLSPCRVNRFCWLVGPVVRLDVYNSPFCHSF